MPFLKIENALNLCKLHLDAIDKNDLNVYEVETYIVAGLILLIVSEYEELIEDIFAERAKLCRDNHVSCYFKTTISQRFRSPDLDKITEILSKFGSDYRQSFHDKVVNSEAHAAWDNIMKARHAIVHKKGVLNITFRELMATYPKTILVIDELKKTMGVI